MCLRCYIHDWKVIMVIIAMYLASINVQCKLKVSNLRAIHYKGEKTKTLLEPSKLLINSFLNND